MRGNRQGRSPRDLRLYVSLAYESDLKPSQMALALVSSRSFVTSTIIGATNLAQLKEYVASIDLQLSDDLIQGIEAIHQDQPNPCP